MIAEQPVVNRAAELHTLLLHIAVSCPYDAAELSSRVARPQQAVHEDLTTLMSDGLVHLQDGALRTSAAARVVAEAEEGELRQIHQQVLTHLVSADSPRTATLIALAESGCRDERLLKLLSRALGDAPGDAALLAAFTVVGRDLGESEQQLELRRATEAALRCQPEAVLGFTEALLDGPADPVRTDAALLAAGAHLQNNRLERAAALYRHVGEERIGIDGAWGVVAAIGQGDIDEARRWRRAMGRDNLTNYAAGLEDFADGLIASASGDGDAALDLLARSMSALAPLGAELLLPETPAAVAALAAFGRGDPATAELLLERALNAQVGGEAGRRRHLLLLAWGRMLQGRIDAAEQRLTELVGHRALRSHRALCDRDLLLYWCLRAGIARRRADLSAMYDAWREIRGHSFGLHITLYDLLPLGEMMVVAARVHDSDRVAGLVQAATDLIARLGAPVVWAAPFYWQGVQAAFQAEDPASLIPYANALARAGNTSTYAATLAAAGQAWLEVLRGDVDFTAVEASARALAQSGHTWDASRLAGQAALQHPERDGALAMMQLAREIIKEHRYSAAPGSNANPKTSMLTAREMEVAQLVLEGQGYRAIGEQLFISPKTVEHHVARIRNRIGAASRAELLEKLHDILTARV